ncbi:hypothetical protein DOK67_0002654 [Enterococcus sp. DIV0212c]|uniref:hypothetical protein n=1 Tax=Enterococcus sp. DIV0212c TaxID=2230867 RepID=UPI001A9B93CB|nr:hypothetical protein [Enterococcus sp. DIV0212c]MBO1353416.1 hypothetical protein [Enterococcus sp. DIV0212c]
MDVLGFTFINDIRIQQGLIMEILLISVLILVFVAIFGNKSKKATYSWEKKKGVNVKPLLIEH